MGKIRLEEMDFLAFHGYYEEERKIGNRYTVTLEVETNFRQAAMNDDLQSTINYEDLYKIVQSVMGAPSKLLEHIGQQVIEKVRLKYGIETKVEISISKHNPPIGGVCAKSTVVMTQLDLV